MFDWISSCIQSNILTPKEVCFTLDIELIAYILQRQQKSKRPRGKKILEQLSRPRFFPGFEISRSFLCAR